MGFKVAGIWRGLDCFWVVVIQEVAMWWQLKRRWLDHFVSLAGRIRLDFLEVFTSADFWQCGVLANGRIVAASRTLCCWMYRLCSAAAKGTHPARRINAHGFSCITPLRVAVRGLPFVFVLFGKDLNAPLAFSAGRKL